MNMEVKGQPAMLGSGSPSLRQQLLSILFLLVDSRLPDLGTSTRIACLHLLSPLKYNGISNLYYYIQMFYISVRHQTHINKLVPQVCFH